MRVIEINWSLRYCSQKRWKKTKDWFLVYSFYIIGACILLARKALTARTSCAIVHTRQKRWRDAATRQLSSGTCAWRWMCLLDDTHKQQWQLRWVWGVLEIGKIGRMWGEFGVWVVESFSRPSRIRMDEHKNNVE